MTRRKSDLQLPSRTPAYVSREVGAAELGISPETWDRWVQEEILPPYCRGFPASTPRWKWSDVELWLQGTRHLEPDVADPFMVGAHRMKNGPTQNKKSRAA